MKFGFVDSSNMALLTDLYELTMAQVYHETMSGTAVFEYFIRPDERRDYYIMAGLEQLLYFLTNMRFSKEDIEFLDSLKKFDKKFLDFLGDFRFTGDVWALREGEFFFANEPVVSVRAPILQAQIVETFLINTLQHPIMVATKAARCVSVAKECKIVDFGLRRAHGTDAGMKAARSSYVAGFIGTSNLLAAKYYGIPAFGTMAHSFVMVHDSEEEAFERFMRKYPQNAILLVDTYDTIEGTKKAIEVSKRLQIPLKGVRLDSGDIESLAFEVRELLDRAGMRQTMILVSGGVDEFMIQKLLAKNVPIDSWGVGTKLVVCEDMPSLDCAYKLVEYEGRPRIKKSAKKATIPLQKQIIRKFDENGLFVEDTIEAMQKCPEGLLQKVMENGKVLIREDLESIRIRARKSLRALPQPLKRLEPHTPTTPTLSPYLKSVIKGLRIP